MRTSVVEELGRVFEIVFRDLKQAVKKNQQAGNIKRGVWKRKRARMIDQMIRKAGSTGRKCRGEYQQYQQGGEARAKAIYGDQKTGDARVMGKKTIKLLITSCPI